MNILAICVAASLILLGCTSGQTAISAGELTIYVHGNSLLPRGGEDALIEGELAIRGNCVLLTRDDVAYPVLWPSGTSIAQEDPLTLKLPSNEFLEVGQQVSGGGGYHRVGSNQVTVDIDYECLTDAEPSTQPVAVFNPDGELAIEPHR